MGKPVCATGDVHFLDPEDEIFRHILLDTKKFSDCDCPLPIYFKSTDEALRAAVVGRQGIDFCNARHVGHQRRAYRAAGASSRS